MSTKKIFDKIMTRKSGRKSSVNPVKKQDSFSSSDFGGFKLTPKQKRQHQTGEKYFWSSSNSSRRNHSPVPSQNSRKSDESGETSQERSENSKSPNSRATRPTGIFQPRPMSVIFFAPSDLELPIKEYVKRENSSKKRKFPANFELVSQKIKQRLDPQRWFCQT